MRFSAPWQFRADDPDCASRYAVQVDSALADVAVRSGWLDSFEGIRRFREMTTETAGFMNTVGFNDDTRALCSIPARHDVSRRADSAFRAELVGCLAREGHRLK